MKSLVLVGTEHLELIRLTAKYDVFIRNRMCVAYTKRVHYTYSMRDILFFIICWLFAQIGHPALFARVAVHLVGEVSCASSTNMYVPFACTNTLIRYYAMLFAASCCLTVFFPLRIRILKINRFHLCTTYLNPLRGIVSIRVMTSLYIGCQ